MKGLLNLLNIEERDLTKIVNALDPKDELIKNLKKEDTKLKNITKDHSYHYLIHRDGIEDAVHIGLKDYLKEDIIIGPHRSSYEKITEEAQKYNWVDLVGIYKNLCFEPKDLRAFKKIKNFNPWQKISLRGKAMDKSHEEEVPIALNNLKLMFGRNYIPKTKINYNKPYKIKRIIVNNPLGVHARVASQFVEATNKFFNEKKGNYLDFISIVEKSNGEVEEKVLEYPNSIMEIMTHAIIPGSEIILGFHGPNYESCYEKMCKAIDFKPRHSKK